MKDVWGREVKQLDLVLAYPGKGDLGNASYGLVVGTNNLYMQNNEVLKVSTCYIVENKTEEQVRIAQQLKEAYRQHINNVVQSGGYKKIEPKEYGWYQGDSALISYLYLGYWKIGVSANCIKPGMPDSYSKGGYCYLKILKDSYMEKDLTKLFNCDICGLDAFKRFIYDYTNMLKHLETYKWYVNIPQALSNFVISSRKRTFQKELGLLKLDARFSNEEYFDSSYIDTNVLSRLPNEYSVKRGYFKFYK